MVSIEELIDFALKNDCSDIHLDGTLPVIFRRMGKLVQSHFELGEEGTEKLILSLLTERRRERLADGADLDFSFECLSGRQWVNVYRQKNRLCAAIRILSRETPTLEDLGLPQVLGTLDEEPRGLVLVTGHTGSGKSTTFAAMIDRINQRRSAHIITIEDPIEYVYNHGNSMIHQREIGADVGSFAAALRSAMREDPDVILVGEMRDYETIAAAVTAAETGHLVLSTLHTTGAAQTLDRIIDVFPPHSQGQIRSQMAGVLKGIITQTLIPRADGTGRVAAAEILVGTDAVLSLIREGKNHQIPSMMQAGG
ncbi:MAG: PilT/PilU family type 4a pilus ATPase, partial [Bacillota bacterium]|nr:PilT/PilU family type 4a pilus ATPase [Bacillota bacterium]